MNGTRTVNEMRAAFGLAPLLDDQGRAVPMPTLAPDGDPAGIGGRDGGATQAFLKKWGLPWKRKDILSGLLGGV